MTAPSGVVAGAARIISPGLEHSRGESLTRDHGMDEIRELLTAARTSGLVVGNFRGLLHIAIGRTITRPDGSTVSNGVTWRELAAELKHLRFDTELVRELGADPDELAARDRERFWYSAIALARVDSYEAVEEAEKLAPKFKSHGFIVGPPPAGVAHLSPSPKKTPPVKAREPSEKPKKKKKK
jgi:hypothetical protein